MTLTLPPVTSATTADVDEVAHLVAGAFFPLRASRWLVPDAEPRQAALAGQFAILIGHALAFGQVDLLADGSAAAVWFHRHQPIPDPPDYDRRLLEACGEYADRFRTLDDLFAEHHPTEAHHHLAMLAVAPGYQSTGRGTLLLRRHHEILDERDLPAYLEAAGIRSANLYHREGYRLYTEPFSLPNEASFHPMWRIPTRRRPPVAEANTPARQSIGASAAPPRTSAPVRRDSALA